MGHVIQLGKKKGLRMGESKTYDTKSKEKITYINRITKDRELEIK